MTWQIAIGPRTRQVDVVAVPGARGRFLATIDGREYEIDWHQVADGRFSLVWLGDRRTSHEVVIEPAPDRHEVEVHVDGRGFRAAFAGRPTGRSAGASDAGATGDPRVVAPMPGRVVRVLVAVGQDVTAGQGLVVVEAMKMENELRAPSAGRVAEIGVTEGASVEAGRVLVLLERPPLLK